MVKSLTSHGRDIALRLRHSLVGRPFVRHVGALTLANGVVAVLSLVQGILVARWLGPELYGVAALVMSVPALVYTFFDARSAEALVKYLSEFHARGERERAAAMCCLGYFTDFSIALVSFSAVLLIALWASRTIVRRPELSWLMVLYAAAFLPRSLKGTSYAVMAVLGFFPTIALIDTIITSIQVGLVVGFVLLGWGVIGVVWGNTLAMTIAGLLYGVSAWRLMERSWGRIGWSKSWSLLKGYRREIFRFLVYNDLTALLGLLTKQLDLVLLGYSRGPVEVGWYKLAKNAAGSVAYLVGPLQSVAYQRFATLAGLDQQKLLQKKVRDFALKVGIPLGLTALVGGEVALSLIPTVVGSQYTPAVGAARFLLIGFSLWLAFFWLRPLFLARGVVKEWTFVTLVFSLMTFVGWSVAVRFSGYIGMSIWWTMSVALFYIGLGVIVYYSRFNNSKSKPDWDEYTARLALKGATTATNTELLNRYARGRILDAGCGTGVRLSQVSTWSGVELVVGVDVGMPGLRYAKQNYPSISVIQANVCNLPFKNDQFDFVYSIDVVEHLDDPRTALKEFYRVCKPGAYLFVQTPNYPIKRLYDLLHYISGSRHSLEDDPTHISKFSSRQIVKLLLEIGFQIEQVQARNILFERYLPWLKRLKSNTIGITIGQKVIVIARKV